MKGGPRNLSGKILIETAQELIVKYWKCNQALFCEMQTRFLHFSGSLEERMDMRKYIEHLLNRTKCMINLIALGVLNA